jgi:hypothetical protein
MVCDGVSGAGGGGGDEDERAVVGSGNPRPPRRQHRGGTPVPTSSEASGQSQAPSSVAVLLVAERVRPIVAAPTAYPVPVAVGCRHPVPPVGYRRG